MLNFLLRGGPVMFLLLGCSLLVLSIVLERLWFWLDLKRTIRSSARHQANQWLKEGNQQDLSRLLQQTSDPVLLVLKTGLSHCQGAPVKAMEDQASIHLQQMQRYLKILDTMITVAPLLGILGTVLGIIDSFQVLGVSGIDNPKAVTGGIAEALLTTAAGLSISILTVFPFNYFNACTDQMVYEMEHQANQLELLLASPEYPVNNTSEPHFLKTGVQ